MENEKGKMNYEVATFYRFTTLQDLEGRQEALIALCEEEGVLGTVLLAGEGLNGTIAGPKAGVARVLAELRAEPAFAGLEARRAEAESIPFQRLKVKVKDEIVTLRAPADPRAVVGTYLGPQEWNEMIRDPEVLVIDTRNDFEVRHGTFVGAVNPETEKFCDFPEYVERELGDARQKKIAMFCTGGIRCEKATSYLLSQGFEEVYHLEGGILRYLDEVSPEESLWKGKCFVFDERETVG